MVRLADNPYMTIAVDWNIKYQTKQTNQGHKTMPQVSLTLGTS